MSEPLVRYRQTSEEAWIGTVPGVGTVLELLFRRRRAKTRRGYWEVRLFGAIYVDEIYTLDAAMVHGLAGVVQLAADRMNVKPRMTRDMHQRVASAVLSSVRPLWINESESRDA